MADYKIPVSLTRIDWEAVLISIRRHANDQHLSGGRVCYEVGRARLLHIAAAISERVKKAGGES